jgi:aldehyde dehydrogenase (NAD+)
MDIRMISFTGSVRTGQLIQIAAAKSNLKNVILELGGKSPAVIFDDADLEKAVNETQISIQRNSGQVCMANSRIYVHESVADRFINLFKEKFAMVNAGDPTVEKTNHGPQADETQYRTVLGYIDEGKKTGTLVLGGNGGLKDLGGYFVQPTIFTDVAEDAKIMKEEIFGPVVVINTFQTEEDVIRKANDTEYGLYASVYTKNIDRAMRMAKAFEAGTVGINVTSPTTARDMPFGGYKTSGIGRESRVKGMDNWLETKTVVMKVEGL